MMKKFAILILAAFLSGCGNKALDGTYTSNWNGRSFTFSPDGTAVESSNGVAIGAKHPYTIKGDTVNIGALNFKIEQDGSIDGGAAYGKLTKK